LTGINHQQLVDAPEITEVLRRYLQYLQPKSLGKPLVLVAHSGKSFDFRVLLRVMDQFGISFGRQVEFVDTRDLFIKDPLPEMQGLVHSKQWRLGHCYSTVFGSQFPGAHDARGDSTALQRLVRKYPADVILKHRLQYQHKHLFRKGARKVQCVSENCETRTWHHPEEDTRSAYWCAEHQSESESANDSRT
jgi:DNA polymerase III alpha subunit (gram-positive type)